MAANEALKISIPEVEYTADALVERPAVKRPVEDIQHAPSPARALQARVAIAQASWPDLPEPVVKRWHPMLRTGFIVAAAASSWGVVIGVAALVAR